MSAAPAKKSDDDPKKPDQNAALLLFTIAADTTWRMFVSTLGGTFLGLWLDSLMNTEPWCAIGGLGIGIVITSFLIRQQYKKANESK